MQKITDCLSASGHLCYQTRRPSALPAVAVYRFVDTGCAATAFGLVTVTAVMPHDGGRWTVPGFCCRLLSSEGLGPQRSGATRLAGTGRCDWRECLIRLPREITDAAGGEKNSPFVRAVMAAEVTSLVTNLGTHGVGYINGDLTQWD